MNARPQQASELPTGQPDVGSLLFPDLVWSHWAWQALSRPHEFRGSPRWVRRWRVVESLRNGRAARGGENGAAAVSERELERLKSAYEREVRRFQDAEGRIIRAYWCTTAASAVVVTQRKKGWLSWLLWWRVGNLELHRATDWVTADAPRIAELLYSGDVLAARINRVLTAVPRLIALEWIFRHQSYLLGFVERSGGHPSRRETESAHARGQVEIDRIERYYDRAAKKAARIWYFGGMLLGLGAVAGLGALTPPTVGIFGRMDLTSEGARAFYLCFVAGALGAVVSVMTRMRNEDGVRLDYEVGKLLIVLLGSFRPVLGAIFGVLAYFAIDSGFLPLQGPNSDKQFIYWALFAFVAGFSERFLHVIVGSADLTLAKAGTGGTAPQSVQQPSVQQAAQDKRDRQTALPTTVEPIPTQNGH